MHEQQRRAYLDAMQVTTWLPRVALPFAAPSNEAILSFVSEAPVQPKGESLKAPVNAAPEKVKPLERSKPIQKPDTAALKAKIEADAVDDLPVKTPVVKAKAAAPRFALQLLRADSCLILLETPTGMALQSRDPSYILLKDMLRAAGLTDKPLLVGDGEPIRWPLLKRSRLDQGPEAARDYVQGVLMAEIARAPCELIWLLGKPSLNYGAGLTEESYNHVSHIEGLGDVWALPSLELLMDEPTRKAPLWQAMQALIPRWKKL